jgi:hypothetical protein
MNILVIGNGFDLAHELPTKYVDFLEWIKAEYALYSNLREETLDLPECHIDWAIKKFPSKIEVKQLDSRKKQLEVWENMKGNFWVNYFLNSSELLEENWIDFEKVIFKIIQSIDLDMREKDFNGQIEQLSNYYLRENFLYKEFDKLFTNEEGERGGKQEITYKKLRDILYEDLNKLIRSFEIYLCSYVPAIDYGKISPDIEGIQCDKVLSFNYTDTYMRLYDPEKKLEYDYIHGKANIDNTVDTNNMVLGIDEYLPDDRKNRDVEFIAFKKFYQRIHKQTGCKYKEWVDKIIDNKRDVENGLDNVSFGRIAFEKYLNKGKGHYLYIFGHSLDITDRDILCDLILNDNVYTTIFYHNKKVMGQQVANLVKVIGQDELIKRTGGSTKTIEFKQQQDMIPVDEKYNIGYQKILKEFVL